MKTPDAGGAYAPPEGSEGVLVVFAKDAQDLQQGGKKVDDVEVHAQCRNRGRDGPGFHFQALGFIEDEAGEHQRTHGGNGKGDGGGVQEQVDEAAHDDDNQAREQHATHDGEIFFGGHGVEAQADEDDAGEECGLSDDMRHAGPDIDGDDRSEAQSGDAGKQEQGCSVLHLHGQKQCPEHDDHENNGMFAGEGEGHSYITGGDRDDEARCQQGVDLFDVGDGITVDDQAALSGICGCLGTR
ncbi:MAG: hypothetical protein HW380_529 [Magnetococcales bacterium]|nr:hypothetical protein [Magnetococcales bacterium]